MRVDAEAKTDAQLDTAANAPSKTSVFSAIGNRSAFRWMYVVDVIMLFAAMMLISVVRWGRAWPNYSMSEYLLGFVIVTIVHVVVAYFGGLYEIDSRLGATSRLQRTASLTGIAILIDASLSLGSSKFLMPRLNLVVFSVLATSMLAFNRWLAHRVLTARFGRPRVLLVGNPDDIELAEAHLVETDRDAIVVGRRSSTEDLALAVKQVSASDVLLLGGIELSEVYPRPLEDFESQRVGVYHRLTPSDTLLGVKKTIQIAGMPFVALRSHAMAPSKARFKRILDLLYLLAASPLILVVLGLSLLYARAVGGRPVLYRQERVGRYGKTFSMVKIRTMYEGAEDATGAVLATCDDARVIPAMAWMRKLRFDELPQIWNVIRGDMALVGPRPERQELAERFEMVMPGYGRRHDIRPGITGLAQVNGTYYTDPGFKLGHDLQYLVNWSPVLDIQILFRTVYVVLARRL
ncbi:MAG: lipopolysaccharide/colanic/teichoic acid biosynthesis glycosyltransferase [Acidimicrobiales bacterium]|jgi:lipopolysaccharide/colanic/teichoic acid biosynthesis glycosyltransferase